MSLDLRPEFIQCAAPEAIRHQLEAARRTLARHERYVARLEELLAARLMQIEAGEWPPPTVATSIT